MIIIKNADIIEGIATKIVAHEGYKITDKDMSFFSDVIYPRKGYFDNNDNPQGYRAIPEVLNIETDVLSESDSENKNLEDQVEQLTALVQSLLERAPE